MNTNRCLVLALVTAALAVGHVVAQTPSRVDFEYLGPLGGAPRSIEVFDDGHIIAYQPFGSNHFESVDDGRTWIPAPETLPGLPTDGRFVRLSNGSVFAPGQNIDTIHFSGDGGRTWLDYPNHLGLAPLVVAQSLAKAGPDELYLGGGVLESNEAELFVSRFGSSWQSVSRIPGMSIPRRIATDGQGTIVVEGLTATFSSVLVYSADFGQTWAELPGDDLFLRGIYVMPDRSVLLTPLGGAVRIEPTTLETAVVHEAGLMEKVLVMDDGTTLMTADSTLVRSDDSGITWTEIARFESNLIDLDLTPDGNLMVVSLETIHRSSDGGHTWTPAVDGIGFLGAWGLGRSVTGELLVGTDEALLGSTGPGYAPTVVHETAEDESVVQFIENRDVGDYLLTLDGDLFVRPTGSTSLERRRTEDRRIWGFDVSRDGQILAISGTQDLHVSSDAGLTWRNTWDAVPTVEFNGWDVAVGPSGSLFMTADDGLFRSDDLGTSWDPILNEPLRSVEVLSGGEILVGDRTAVWRSDDDGASFLLVDYPGTFENLVEMPDGTLFSAECDGLRRSDDRGITWYPGATWGGVCPINSHIDPDGTIWLTTWDTGLYRGTSPVFVSNEPTPEMPTEVFRLGIYPNPLRDASQLTLSLPSAGLVRVEVFDMLGRRVTVAIDRHLTAGEHTVAARFGALPGGAYVARLSLDGRPVAAQTVVRTR